MEAFTLDHICPNICMTMACQYCTLNASTMVFKVILIITVQGMNGEADDL